MMGQDTYRKAAQSIERRLRREREKQPQPDLIPIIENLISEYTDPDVINLLRVHLRHEYLDRSDFKTAAQIALAEIECRPYAPMPLLVLAEQLHFSEGKADEAMLVAAKAILLADEAKEFRRHARAVLLRSASDVGNAELVRSCLREIIELDLQPGEIDVGKDDDLLMRASRMPIEKELLDRYQAFLMTP